MLLGLQDDGAVGGSIFHKRSLKIVTWLWSSSREMLRIQQFPCVLSMVTNDKPSSPNCRVVALGLKMILVSFSTFRNSQLMRGCQRH